MLGRAPTPQEMATELGVDLEEFFRLNEELSTQAPLSLDELGVDIKDGGLARQDLVIHARNRSIRIKEIVETLPEKQKLVLSLVYFNELSQKEVAQVLGVTEARVSQLHKEALDRLKKRMQSLAKPNEDAW